jgi:arylsulfatase A-like enzyme
MKALVLVARGLQLGALGCYGNAWIQTPALDGLAAEGVVFDQHFADGADPSGARRAWRTGRYHLPAPPPSGDSSSQGDLLASLRGKGIFTCLIGDNSRPSLPEFEAGWDEVERLGPTEEATALEAVLEAADAALGRLAEREDWLLWIDVGTVLPPWDVPEEFQGPYFEEETAAAEEEEDEEAEEGPLLTPLREVEPGTIDPEDDALFLSVQSSYAAAVSYLDAGISQLLESLHERGRDEEVLVVFTSDCGQNLGEHGVLGAVRPWLHDEVIHLPLIIRLPAGSESGRRVFALTQGVDLAPTLADWFAAALEEAHGHSLLPLMHGDVEQIRPYACAGLEVGQAIEWALRTPEWACLLPVQASEDATRKPQLYVKPDDRWEVNDVRQHHLELAEQLEQTLREFVTATRQSGPLKIPPLPELEVVGEAVPEST